MSCIETVMFKTGIKGKLDKEDIIEAICCDSDARGDICSYSQRRVLNFIGDSLSSIIESVNLDTLNYIKSFDYEDVYMVDVKVKEIEFSKEDVYNAIKDRSYFSKLCKLFDDNNIEYDKLTIADFFFLSVEDELTKEELMDEKTIEWLQSFFDNETSVKFISEHKKDIFNILDDFCDELDDLDDDDDDGDVYYT